MPVLLRHLTLALWGAVAVLTASAAAGPVSFEFTPSPDPAVANPFARELWAEMFTPSGKKLVLPAYFAGHDTFAVRARPDEAGTYRFGAVTDTTGGKAAIPIDAKLRSPATVENPAASPQPAIRLDPRIPAALVDADGRPYIPVGANLAWSNHGPAADFYGRALPAFGQAGLNWMRIWMAHWDGLNLDWLPPDRGPSPAPGTIDLAVAETWDRIIETAGAQGVYVQVVLQHHGQYSTGPNPNWAENPWNAAHPGGFLRKPADFFTSPEARRLTALKYRYIVARWGWSPAVFAWELFNEVHWVDALAKDKDVAAVAAWHGAMAGLLRSVDAYHHLITTSTEDLRSPIYDQLDFYQPHLYAANLIAGARTHPEPAADRPVFYGEVGDDHLAVSETVKKSGATIVPAVWASLMGTGNLPAQPWEGWQLLDQGRLGELGAVRRFITGSGIGFQPDLVAFSAVVESATRVPLRLVAGQVWQRRAGPDFELPLDGREPLGLADVPDFLVGPEGHADGFPSSGVFHFDYPRDATLRVQVAGVGRRGASLRLSLDGRVMAESHWPGPALPAEIAVPIPAGRHTFAVENPAGPDWVEVPEIDLGLDTSVLAAIGRRSNFFIALWVRHRTNLYAPEPLTPATGTLVIDDVPAGPWRVVWWDTAQGVSLAPTTLNHAGGTLRLPVPPVRRHAAVVLTRDDRGK